MFCMKDIAFKCNTCVIEELPLPYVLYPGHYGAFIGFQESQEG